MHSTKAPILPKRRLFTARKFFSMTAVCASLLVSGCDDGTSPTSVQSQPNQGNIVTDTRPLPPTLDDYRRAEQMLAPNLGAAAYDKPLTQEYMYISCSLLHSGYKQMYPPPCPLPFHNLRVTTGPHFRSSWNLLLRLFCELPSPRKEGQDGHPGRPK